MVVSTTGVVTWTPLEGALTSGAVTLTVRGGGEDGAAPDTEIFTVTVTAVNDPPTMTSTAGTTATEDVLYTYTATVTDPDDANNGIDLTWSLSGEPAGMVVSTTGVVTWTPLEGVLTSGAVTLTVQDSGEDSAAPDTEIFTVTVTPVNDPPDILIGGVPKDTLNISTNEDTPLSVMLMITDPEGNNISVNSGLSVTGIGTITTDPDPFTFNYSPAQDFFGMETLMVFVCEDGIPIQCDTLTVISTVNAVNDKPVITGIASSLNYTEGDGPVSAADMTITDDVDDTDLEGAVISITANYQSGEDVLAFTDQNGISGNVISGVLTLTGTSSVANYQTALRSITYENSSLNPNISIRTLSFTTNDGDIDSDPITMNIILISINSIPTIDGNPADLVYTEGMGTVLLDDMIIVNDLDDTSLEGAVITFSGNFQSGEDILAFTDQNGITGNLASNILTLTGSANLADYQAALRSITYENISNTPNISLRTVEFIVNDGDDDSMPFIRNIIITSVVEAPVLSGLATALDYTEGDGKVVIDATIGITDGDDTNLESSTVSLTNNYVEAEDFLGFNDQMGITGTFDGMTGVLSLSGSSSIANYQTALQSVTYENTSDDPSTALRVVSFVANDGEINSNIITHNINITPVNDPPVAVDDFFMGLEDQDLDLTGNVLDNDSDPEGDLIVLNTVPQTIPQNGILVLNADGSFTYTPDDDFFGDDTFIYQICDDGNPSLCDVATVTLTFDEVDEVIVYQAVSPNADGFNDYWRIQDIYKYPNNVVKLYDRWNSLVYEQTGYDNDIQDKRWEGKSNSGITNGELPNGTYFYTISLGDGRKYKGFIILRR